MFAVKVFSYTMIYLAVKRTTHLFLPQPAHLGFGSGQIQACHAKLDLGSHIIVINHGEKNQINQAEVCITQVSLKKSSMIELCPSIFVLVKSELDRETLPSASRTWTLATFLSCRASSWNLLYVVQRLKTGCKKTKHLLFQQSRKIHRMLINNQNNWMLRKSKKTIQFLVHASGGFDHLIHPQFSASSVPWPWSDDFQKGSGTHYFLIVCTVDM